MALRGAHDRCSFYLNLCDQDVCDASQHSHKVEHIPGCFQVILQDKDGSRKMFSFFGTILGIVIIFGPFILFTKRNNCSNYGCNYFL